MSYLQQQIASLLRSAVIQAETEPYHEVLEYIETDGTQYYKTGEILSSTDKVEFRASTSGTALNPSTGNQGSAYFFGAYKSNEFFGLNRAATGGTYVVWRNTNTTSLTHSFEYDTFYDVSVSSDGVYVDGVKEASVSGSFTGSKECYISWANGTSQPVAKIKLACLKIYKSGVLTKDYIPVLDSQMRPCLYDKISKTFLYHTNSEGSTSPSFKRWNKYDVDYIENPSTSYIALSDITPSTTMGMNIEYAYTTLSSSEPAGVIGTYNGDTQRKDTFFVSTSSGSTEKASSPSSASCGVMVFHRGGNVGTSSSSSASYIEPEKDVWYTATVNWLGDGEIYWTNGTTDLQASVGANAVMTNGLRLFSRCNSSNNTYNNCKSRVRKLQFSDGSTIIRDYVPVVWHNGDNTAVATLYDKVYNRMLTPTGSLKAYIIGYGNVFTRTGETTGKFIDADGNIQNNANSAYSDLLPIKGGETVSCKSGTASGNNYRYHVYDLSGNWIEQALVLNPSSAEAITGSFVAPSNASYMRVSYANANTSNSIEVYSSFATYEVGKSVSGTPSSSISGVSNCFDTGLYGTQNTSVKYMAIGYDSQSTSGQLFGSYDGTTSTSNNLTINSTGTGNTAPIRFDGQAITTPIKITLNEFASIVNNRYGLWVNETLHGSWGNVNDFTTLTTMLILKCNNSTNTRNNGCCYCAIYESDKLIAEYIPVRNANNSTEFGLYDKVDKAINTGVGTLNFNELD